MKTWDQIKTLPYGQHTATHGDSNSLATNATRDSRFLVCVARGDVSGAQSALAEGANIDARGDGGWTAVLESVSQAAVLLPFLIENGANVGLASGSGLTPLMRAALGGHEFAVKLLLAAGADLCARDCDGKTVYRLAMEMQEYDCATLVGDELCRKIIGQKYEQKLAAGYELRPISESDRMMVDMARSMVGGTVRRLYFVFDDSSRLEGIRLVDEVVVEVPLGFAARVVTDVGVPFEQG